MDNFNDFEYDYLNDTYRKYKDEIESVYNQYKNKLIENGCILLTEEKIGSHIWFIKAHLVKFKYDYPNCHQTFEYLEEENIPFINRIAGIYNVETGKLDDSLIHQKAHQLKEPDDFLDGWCKYFICDFKGKRTCNIGASNRERAIKCYKFLKRKYRDLNIELYIIDFWTEDYMNIDHLYLDGDGKLTIRECQYAKYIHKWLEQEKHKMLNIDKEIKQVLENAGVKQLYEDYPSSFSLDVFSSLPTFKDKIEYCNIHLKKLGAGSSRIAYRIDNEKVLKIAKNKKGIAQNEAEISFGASLYPQIFAQIFNADTRTNLWLEMELAEKPTTQDFKDIFGIPMKEFFGVVAKIIEVAIGKRMNGKTENSERLYNQFMAEEHPFFYTLQTYLYDYTPQYPADLLRLVNWGKVIRNGQEHIVIIDNGLSDDVARQYYKG